MILVVANPFTTKVTMQLAFPSSDSGPARLVEQKNLSSAQGSIGFAIWIGVLCSGEEAGTCAIGETLEHVENSVMTGKSGMPLSISVLGQSGTDFQGASRSLVWTSALRRVA